MVFFAIAMQCLSTVAAIRRETGGWKWAAFSLFYLNGLAWVASFVVYQGGRLLGYS
jgi:ferrous iron transport protein B